MSLKQIAVTGAAILVALDSGTPAEPRPSNTDMPAATAAHTHTNRLAREKSPYLLQHAHNPVDWYPWGDEAFAKASAENKPVFLSIGYSTCHWCHVMERESFEDETTAAFLNEHFVSIKVDREERPDVDKIYMTFVQAMSGQGGWPLNVFLTPDRKPFFGGTYFPPENRQGRPSFMHLLQNISQLWKTRHGDVLDSAADLHQRLENHLNRETTDTQELTSEVLHNAARRFKGDYDPQNGGFSGAPKFPRPSEPAFLLRYGTRFKNDESIRMVLHTCDRMAAGGMYDQIGGGFHRYSVDAEWLVPHFEKMLYDNAQLLQLYLDAFLVSGEDRHAGVARDIIRYVLRDMTHPDGGFYSAEDADSEGKEGKFYCWTRAELSSLLAPGEFDVAARYFGVTVGGNFVDHSDPDPLPNQNVLSIVSPLSPREGEADMADADDLALLASAKRKMFEARAKRVRPHLDDKVLSSWNGLMLGALARASVVLGEDAIRAAAEKNLAFIQSRLWDAESRTLYHRWRDGERDSVQLLDAYAYLLAGVIDLYEATLNPAHLEFAVRLAESMISKFYDPDDGGFWQAAPGASDLILRVKEDYDGAEPSGNSVAILALLKLGAITDRKEFTEKAEKSLRLFSDRLRQLPQAVPFFMLALDFSLEEPKRAVIVGNPREARTRDLIRAAHSVYQPNKVILGTAGPVEAMAKEFPVEDAPMVYLCTGTACQPPTNDAEKLKQMLR